MSDITFKAKDYYDKDYFIWRVDRELSYNSKEDVLTLLYGAETNYEVDSVLYQAWELGGNNTMYQEIGTNAFTKEEYKGLVKQGLPDIFVPHQLDRLIWA